MKLIPCPLNGLRPADEFVYGGEVRHMPDPATSSDVQWARYVFNRSGIAGVKHEWWCHIASGFWFILERNTLTDEVRSSLSVAQWLSTGQS
jgi:sarcosine oxidase subunit delta